MADIALLFGVFVVGWLCASLLYCGLVFYLRGKWLGRERHLINLHRAEVTWYETLLAFYKQEISQLDKEVLRLKAGQFTEEEFRNLCHTYEVRHSPLSPEDQAYFKQSYVDYRRKLSLIGEHFVLTVKEAQQLGCCRICKRVPPRVPTLLNYGEEFACEECVKEEAEKLEERFLDSVITGSETIKGNDGTNKR